MKKKKLNLKPVTFQFRLPPGIDRSQLQQYLSDEQFQSLFKMSSLKFDTLPKWKKTTLKKGLNLFWAV